MIAPWLLIAAIGQAGAQGSTLAAAAAASGRPPECSPEPRGARTRDASVWQRAREPELQQYCDLLARAQAQTASSPAAARDSALHADRLLPGHAAPAVILARAALALGAADEAAAGFRRARAIDPRSIEEPAAMHDFGRALRRTDSLDEALAVYRALVPRIALFANPDRQVLALLEAAHLSMSAGRPRGGPGAGAAGSATGSLEEAIAYLREAREQPPTQYEGDVLLSLVLVLDRAGRREQAEAALEDAKRRGASPHPGHLDYLTTGHDQLALEALAREASDRAKAGTLWSAFLAGPGGKGPWASAAQARLESLHRRGAGDAASGPHPPGRKP